MSDLHRLQNSIIYLNIFQTATATRYSNLLVRAQGNLNSSLRAISSIVEKAGHEYVFSAGSLSHAVDMSLSRERLLANLLSFFAMIGLLLSLIDLYSVLTFAVQNRTREFAIRKALGAQARSIFRLVLRNALRMIAAGILVGLPFSFAATEALARSLPGEPGTHRLLLLSATVLVALSGAAVALLPSFKAASVDPARALAD